MDEEKTPKKKRVSKVQRAAALAGLKGLRQQLLVMEYAVYYDYNGKNLVEIVEVEIARLDS